IPGQRAEEVLDGTGMIVRILKARLCAHGERVVAHVDAGLARGDAPCPDRPQIVKVMGHFPWLLERSPRRSDVPHWMPRCAAAAMARRTCSCAGISLRRARAPGGSRSQAAGRA